MDVLNFNSVIEDGRYKGKTIEEVFNKKPDYIWKTIKKWVANGVKDKTFSDDVLEAAHIKHEIRDRKVYQEDFYVERDVDVLKRLKKLKKENKSIDEIVDEIDKEHEMIEHGKKVLVDKPLCEDDDFVTSIEDEYNILDEKNELIEVFYLEEDM